MIPLENGTEPVSSSSDIKKSVLWIYYILFFAVLNESVFNVSTPSIANQFNLDAAGVSWVVTIFFIVFGVGIVIFGKLSDIYNVKTLIIIGIILYSFGSILGFALQSWYPGVILSRAIQGAGGSAIPALVFVIVARFFNAKERAKMFGIITSTVSFAIGIGPVLGGYVAGSFHWAFLFLVPLPVLIAIPFFQKYLPKEPRGPGKLDLVGTLLLCILVAMLILFTTEGHWIYLLVTFVALILFIAHIHRVKDPFVDPALFSNPIYRNALIIGFLIYGTVLSVMFAIPLMISKMYGLSTETIGLIMFPGAISAVVFGKVAGTMTVKRGSHFVVYLGLVLIALSLLLQSSSIGLWVWYIGAALIMMFIGFSFVQTALTESVTNILPSHQIGVGMGFFNMISTISGAIVTALVAKSIEQEFFAFPLHPLISDPNAYMYSNLILFLGIIIIASGLLYFVSFRKKTPQPVQVLS
ncbi:MFS transporter [Paenibacillus psychroresistens]|uniref:MFS transporter n=1 Tax=Paenibacillus psychroresistens TaxID=1778678 RepID=A0A6B8RWH5_9BACL|nr:MFS transporter [Paenibacillus psychroresistens]QGQ99733.1 MFS transporter [Paenibacillus psychroresistens]